MLLLNCILYILYSTISIAYGKCYCDRSADSVDDSVLSEIVGRKGSTSGELFERGFIYQRDPAEGSHPLIDRLFRRQVPGPVNAFYPLR